MNHLARRGRLERGGELYGKALENWVFHELTAHNPASVPIGPEHMTDIVDYGGSGD